MKVDFPLQLWANNAVILPLYAFRLTLSTIGGDLSPYFWKNKKKKYVKLRMNSVRRKKVHFKLKSQNHYIKKKES